MGETLLWFDLGTIEPVQYKLISKREKLLAAQQAFVICFEHTRWILNYNISQALT